MSGLPKKYAKMGFAKGWKAYKSHSKPKHREVEVMARRRKSASRGGFKRFARRAAHRAGVGKSVQLFQMDAMIYGGVRQYASDALQPVTAMIPLGNISDEIVMGGLNYMIAKNTSGMISDIAKKGLIIENARVGEAIVQGGLGGLMGSKTSGTGSSAPVYG